jgi:hypothetical protein
MVSWPARTKNLALTLARPPYSQSFPVPQIILATKMGVFLYSVRNPSSATKNFCSTAPTIWCCFAASILTVENFHEAESTRYMQMFAL